MSPPEVWGPPVWTFFHVLAEKVNENAYPIIKNQLFLIIQKICGFLPCPECSRDAAGFLGKVKINDLRSKTDFKNMLFFFHNHVNSKKRKRIYNYHDLEVYKRYNIINSFNNFIRVYHTRGNMKQLSESFQRQFVIRDVRLWFTRNIRAFIPTAPNNLLPPNNQVVDAPIAIEEPITTEEPITSEEPVPKIEEPITSEEPVKIEEPITSEEPVKIEESTIDTFYLDTEYVSQNIFESRSHLFKDNLPDENFNEELIIEKIYTDNIDNTDSVLNDLLDDLLVDVNTNENVTEEPNIDVSVNTVVVKKKSKKRKK